MSITEKSQGPLRTALSIPSASSAQLQTAGVTASLQRLKVDLKVVILQGRETDGPAGLLIAARAWFCQAAHRLFQSEQGSCQGDEVRIPMRQSGALSVVSRSQSR